MASFDTNSVSDKNEILAEIEKIKCELDLQCRVIENVGSFQFVISVSSAQIKDATVKFQLTEKYPIDLPCISVKSNNGDFMRNYLNDLANDYRGEPMLMKLCNSFFSHNSVISAKEVVSTHVEASVISKKDRKKKKKTEDVKENEDKCPKKSMKTADDVIKRFQWDEQIPKMDVYIGYLDRFKGVMEKCFDVFSWEDISSVDYYTFVIPRHRIQYFKYKKAIVWDKRTRLDNVFGSTGSGLTFYDVMRDYRDEDYETEEAQPTVIDMDSCSDSEDDDFEVTVNRGSVAAAQNSYSDDDDEGIDTRLPLQEGTITEKKYWNDLCRPNFFICVRITDPEIIETVTKIQTSIINKQPLLESCCVTSAMLHCTLLTLRLNSAEEIANCGKILKEASEELQSSLPRSPLWVYGTSCFHERVLYARVHHGDDFLPFVDHLRAVVSAAGVPVMDQHEFIPHITLLKTSRPVSRQMGTREIAPYLYAGTKSTDFGEQRIDAIYLCSMEKARGPDGFYVSPDCVVFERAVLTRPNV